MRSEGGRVAGRQFSVDQKRPGEEHRQNHGGGRRNCRQAEEAFPPVAGERDRIVPAKQSRVLYEAVPEPKRFVLVPGAGHNDLELLVGDQLIGELLRFLGEMAVIDTGEPPPPV